MGNISTKEVIIANAKGIHTRVAAWLSFKASIINNKYEVMLFIQRKDEDHKVPLSSMMALLAMSLKKEERVLLSCEMSKYSTKALEDMASFFTDDINVKNNNIDEVDSILKQNVILNEKLTESIFNGIVVVDKNNVIVLFNKAAESITNIPRQKIIGRKANEMLENSRLHEVIKTGIPIKGDKQKISKTTIITDRTPIVSDGEIIGAVAIFQNITETEKLSDTLESVRETKERLSSILNHASDAICMLDQDGIITYVNPKFYGVWLLEKKPLLNYNIFDVLPKIIKEKTLTKKKDTHIILKRNDGVKIISDITPIFVDNMFKGNVILFKEVREIQKIIEKLVIAEEKIEYFEKELEKEQHVHEAFNNTIGDSGILKNALSIASKAAKTAVTVLIRGESGTGKELVAQGIHNASLRVKQPFIKVNCSAIPITLLESELFGHEKGSFTGATNRKLGKFELAQNGTIFLDEIGDISKEMQSKILRVLQEKEIQRVGSIETIKTDVRIIAATNRNLEEMLQSGEFREDLYYRLDVIPVFMPSLRERKRDIPSLIEYFINKICKEQHLAIKKISKSAIDTFVAYDWPGNIRELENIIKRTIVLSDSKLLNEKYLLEVFKPTIDNHSGFGLINTTNGDVATMQEYEREIIKYALDKYGSFNKAGKALGLCHRTIGLKAKKFKLK
ncbi:MAG: sigma 54-interacting transcriptional regulator [Alkaliphilus sp.]